MAFDLNHLPAKSTTLALGLLGILIIGVADYLSGTEISLAIFYLLPIALVTWFAGRETGIFFAVLASAVSFLSDCVIAHRVYSHLAIPYWNAVMRGGVSVILVMLVSRLQVALLHEKEISRVKSNMLSLVGHFNLAMSANADLPTVGQSVLETINVFFPGCVATLRLLNPATGELEPLASAGVDELEWTNEAVEWPALAGVVDMNPKIVRNIQKESQNQNHNFCHRNGLVSYLGFPLIAGGRCLGVISLYTRETHEFSEEKISFFRTLAGQAAIALQNVRLFNDVRTGQALLRDLSRRLLDVQEFDRRHLAQELHDEIGQILTGLHLTLEMTGRAPTDQVRKTLETAQDLVNDLIGRVRGLSLDLRPSMLDDLGLLPALLWHFNRYTTTTGVQIEFSHQGLDGARFEAQVETAAYRIVQEALTNVARHARVNRADVHVWCLPQSLLLEIQDEGAGFDSDTAIRSGNSIGLTGMRERANLLGGDLSIDSTPGSGTSVIAELPFGKQQEDHATQWAR